MKKTALLLSVLAVSVGSLMQSDEEWPGSEEPEMLDVEISKMLKRQTLPWSTRSWQCNL